MSLYEIAIVTRAGQAKALGLKEKGHLGLGADADVSIYNVNPTVRDLSKEFRAVRKAFKRAAFTIKGGDIVVKDGEVMKHVEGRTLWIDPQISEGAKISEEMRHRFREYWTVEYENYPVPEDHLAVSHPIMVKAGV